MSRCKSVDLNACTISKVSRLVMKCTGKLAQALVVLLENLVDSIFRHGKLEENADETDHD